MWYSKLFSSTEEKHEANDCQWVDAHWDETLSCLGKKLQCIFDLVELSQTVHWYSLLFPQLGGEGGGTRLNCIKQANRAVKHCKQMSEQMNNYYSIQFPAFSNLHVPFLLSAKNSKLLYSAHTARLLARSSSFAQSLHSRFYPAHWAKPVSLVLLFARLLAYHKIWRF